MPTSVTIVIINEWEHQHYLETLEMMKDFHLLFFEKLLFAPARLNKINLKLVNYKKRIQPASSLSLMSTSHWIEDGLSKSHVELYQPCDEDFC